MYQSPFKLSPIAKTYFSMTKFNLILFIFVYLCLITNALARKLPSFLIPCHRDDPQLNSCLEKNIELLGPRLKNGIPELLIPSLDPLVIPEASLESGDSFKATFKNIEIYHANEFKPKTIDFNLTTFDCRVALHFDRMRIKSIFNIKGKILILELNGQGPADGNFTHVEAEILMKGKLVKQKDGRQLLEFYDRKLNLDLGKPVFLFENLFAGNDELNAQTNRILNDNVESLIDELKPVINKIVTDFVFGVIHRLFIKFSYDDLFPK